MLLELQRRKWPTLEVGPLATWRKRDIVEAFLRRSLTRGRRSQTPASEEDRDAAAGGNSSRTFLTGIDACADEASTLPGSGALESEDREGIDWSREGSWLGYKSMGRRQLVLFPSMIEKIVKRCTN